MYELLEMTFVCTGMHQTTTGLDVRERRQHMYPAYTSLEVNQNPAFFSCQRLRSHRGTRLMYLAKHIYQCMLQTFTEFAVAIYNIITLTDAQHRTTWTGMPWEGCISQACCAETFMM
jgi:hypothetical protein